MKFSFKDFDYKEFFIQNGEKIGLWTAVGIMALLLIFVIKDVFAGPSASQNAKLLTDLSLQKKGTIDSSTPSPDVPIVPSDIEKGATPPPVPEGLYATSKQLFNPTELEDKKWRLPTVVPPEDFVVRYVQAQVPSYIFQKAGDEIQVAVLESGRSSEDIKNKVKTQREKKRRDKLSPRQQRIDDYLKQIRGGGMGPMGRPGGGPMNMQPGGGPGGPGGMPIGGGPGGRMGGMMGMMGGGGGMMQMMQNMGGGYGSGMGTGGGAKEYTFSWVSYEKSEQESDWAQTMLPWRMVIVTGAFPLKEELETFRQALRFPDVQKMLENADFEFSGLTVERREAKTVEELQKKEWKLLDVETNMKEMMMRAAGKEPDDAKLESSGIIFKPNRIFMPLPKLETELHKDNKYPVSQEDLPKSIQETLTAIEKADKPSGMARKKKSRFELGSYDLFDEGDEGTRGQATAPAQDTTQRAGTLSNEPAEPDKCLVRFVDVDVKPGMVYEYRVKVRMINPNYEDKEKAVSKAITLDPQIEAREWAVVPEKVKIPEETLLFAVDEKRLEIYPDRVPVQVQRWLDVVQPDPKNSSSEVPVGEWSILEKIMAHRGEYIGETKEVEVPIWVTTMKKFLFALHPDDTPLRKKGIAPVVTARRPQHKGIPVSFNTGTLLVDFEGGKRYYPVGSKPVFDEGPVELLVLSPDGKKLLVHNSRADTDNPERKKHLEEWKSIQEKVKEEVENTKGGGKKDRYQFGGPGTR